MTEERIKAQIAELQALAMEAYRKKNFRLEDEYDRQITELKRELERIPFLPPELKEGECREHHWDAHQLAQYGNARCRICQMQHRYYMEGQARLSTWTEEERKTRDYAKITDYYRCKAHRHNPKHAEQQPSTSIT